MEEYKIETRIRQIVYELSQPSLNRSTIFLELSDSVPGAAGWNGQTNRGLHFADSESRAGGECFPESREAQIRRPGECDSGSEALGGRLFEEHERDKPAAHSSEEHYGPAETDSKQLQRAPAVHN